MRRTSSLEAQNSESGGAETDSAQAELKCKSHSINSGQEAGQLNNRLSCPSNRDPQRTLSQLNKISTQVSLQANNRRRREYRVVLFTLLVLVSVYLLCFAPRFATRVIWELAGLGVEINMNVVLLLSRVGDFGQPLYALVSFLVHVGANRRYRRLLNSLITSFSCIRCTRREYDSDASPHRNYCNICPMAQFANNFRTNQEATRRQFRVLMIGDGLNAARSSVARSSGYGRNTSGCFPLLYKALRDIFRHYFCCCCFRHKSNPYAEHWANNPTQTDLQCLERAFRGGYQVRGYPMNESHESELLPQSLALQDFHIKYEHNREQKNIRDSAIGQCAGLHRLQPLSEHQTFDNINWSLFNSCQSPICIQPHCNKPDIEAHRQTFSSKIHSVPRPQLHSDMGCSSHDIYLAPEFGSAPAPASAAPESPCKRVVSECREHSKVFVWSRERPILQLQNDHFDDGGVPSGLTHALTPLTPQIAQASPANPFRLDVPRLRNASSNPNIHQRLVVSGREDGRMNVPVPDPAISIPLFDKGLVCSNVSLVSEPVLVPAPESEKN